jgi:hypothetical protein
MLALVIAMVICVALGAGVVVFVMIEARREGRGGFWTAEGEELIAGVRRTGERVGGKVKAQGSRLGSSAVERSQTLRERLPERPAQGEHAVRRSTPPTTDPSDEDLRAAS